MWKWGVRVLTAAVMFAMPAEAMANCTTNGAVFSIFQCGFVSWFAPPPPGAGIVTASWWQLGYGNARVTAPAGTVFTDTQQGTGIGPAGVFSGNDNGSFAYLPPPANVAWTLGGHPQASLIPDGARCVNSYTDWGASGVDGCADNPRTTAGTDNDNLLNTYCELFYGCPYYTLNYQIDYPMALILRESTGQFFSAAFIANKKRGNTPEERANDADQGFFDLGEVANGDQNPITLENDIIPWQSVPAPQVGTVIPPPAPGEPWTVGVSWDNVRVVSDQSVRPSSRGLLNPGSGVGVFDQGTLVSFIVETAASPSANPGPLTLQWSGGPLISAPPTSTVSTTVALPESEWVALRIRTILGKRPRTATTSLAQCRLGACGDVGFEATACDATSCLVSPPVTVVQTFSCDIDSDMDGFLACSQDCSDVRATVYPGAPEICDGFNNDCDHPNWPSLTGTNDGDVDGDGRSACQGDCDESRPTVYGGAPQLCGDSLNNDCLHPSWPALTVTNEVDDDGDSLSECSGDCDDTHATVAPGAPQICDGLNNDCLHPSWPSPAGTEDGDDDLDGLSECSGDCNDARAAVRPGGTQLCGDSLNNDCLHPSWPALTATNEADDDADAFTECQNDCNDAVPAINPAVAEICNAIDDDCDGLYDEDTSNAVDSDGDAVRNVCDNCRFAFNPSQADTDHDVRGNSCDNCVLLYNPGQEDLDSDQRGNLCDNCPTESNTLQDDSDQDTVGDVCDNCATTQNADQRDLDTDFEGDLCDLDDGVIVIHMSSSTTVTWQQEAGHLYFNVYRGALDVLRAATVYTQDPALVASAEQFCFEQSGTLFEPFTPFPGEIVFYLVTGVDLNVVEGGLGANSAGQPRPHDNPCP